MPATPASGLDRAEYAPALLVLSPIWLTKPETARRVRQRIGAVLDWGKAAGFREGDNPVAGVAKGLPKQPERRAHHAALPYDEVPAFIAAFGVASGSARTCVIICPGSPRESFV